MKTGVVYCRISRDPGNDALGVKRQEADCRALCERHGIEVLEVLIDDDISAYNRKRRPGYERMLELLSAGKVGAVVAWHPDRLTRHPRELEDLIDSLERAKATVRTVQTGEYDLATPSGRMTARIVGAVARGESEHKAARLRRKHEELAENGKSSGGGTRPFGYEADRVTINKPEAKIVREMAQRVIAGGSVRSIVADLTARGVPTVTGKRWSTTVVANLLMSGQHAGLRIHRTGTFPAEWPAIIGEADHRRLVEILTDPARRKNAGARRYLLTGGIAECGLCGAALVARPKGDKRKCLVCATGPGFDGCGKIRTLVEPVDELVIEAVLARLDTPDLAASLATVDVDDSADIDELQRIDRRLIELGEMWAAGDLDRESWKAARRKLTSDRTTISERVRSKVTARPLSPQTATQGTLRATWPTLTIDEQRSILGAVIEAVVIGPAVRGRNFFDPDRVSIRWRV